LNVLQYGVNWPRSTRIDLALVRPKHLVSPVTFRLFSLTILKYTSTSLWVGREVYGCCPTPIPLMHFNMVYPIAPGIEPERP
jgi:hypothetical protein